MNSLYRFYSSNHESIHLNISARDKANTQGRQEEAGGNFPGGSRVLFPHKVRSQYLFLVKGSHFAVLSSAALLTQK